MLESYLIHVEETTEHAEQFLGGYTDESRQELDRLAREVFGFVHQLTREVRRLKSKSENKAFSKRRLAWIQAKGPVERFMTSNHGLPIGTRVAIDFKGEFVADGSSIGEVYKIVQKLGMEDRVIIAVVDRAPP